MRTSINKPNSPPFHQLPACRWTWCWIQTTRPPSVSAGRRATEPPPTPWALWPMMARTTAPPAAAAATSRASPVAPTTKSASQRPALPAWVYPATLRTWKQVRLQIEWILLQIKHTNMHLSNRSMKITFKYKEWIILNNLHMLIL